MSGAAGGGGTDRASLLARIRAALRSQHGGEGDDSDISDLPATAFSEVPQSAYDALAARLDGTSANGQPVADLFADAGDDAANRAAVVMLNGLSQGPLAIAQNLAQVLQMSQNRAETIARNELVSSYRDAQMANYRANSDVVGSWMWSAAVASACICCVDMDGTIHSMDEDLIDHVMGRCEPLPITRSWDDIMSNYGLSADGIPETSITESYGTGRDWFMRQDDATQIGVMGPAKWIAWQQGDISLDDLVGIREDGAWGGAVYERSLKELGLDAQDYLPRAPQTGLGPQGRRAVENADLRQAVMRARGGEGLGPQGHEAIKGAERTAAEMDMVRIDMGNGMFTYVLRDDASQFDAAADLTSAARGTGWQNIDDVLAKMRGEATQAVEELPSEAAVRNAFDKGLMTGIGDNPRITYRITADGHDYFVKKLPYMSSEARERAGVSMLERLGDDYVLPTAYGTLEDETPYMVQMWTGGQTLESVADPAAVLQALPLEDRVRLTVADYLLGDGDKGLSNYLVLHDGSVRFTDFEFLGDAHSAQLDLSAPLVRDAYGDTPLSEIPIPRDLLDTIQAQREALLADARSGHMTYEAAQGFKQRMAVLDHLATLDNPTLADLQAGLRGATEAEAATGAAVETATEAATATEPTVSFATDAVQARLMGILDNPTEGEFARLMGAQPGDRVEVERHGQVTIRSDARDSYVTTFVNSPDEETGAVGMYLQQYSATDGTRLPVDDHFAAMLRTQVEQVQASGGSSPLSYIIMKARARVGDYESLLEVGFDAPIDMHVLTEAQAAGLPPLLPAEFAEKFPGVNTLSELVSTPEGREWWHVNGMNPDLTFNLAPDSKSVQRLNEYLAAHDMPLVSEATTAAATEAAPAAGEVAAQAPEITAAQQRLDDAAKAIDDAQESYDKAQAALNDAEPEMQRLNHEFAQWQHDVNYIKYGGGNYDELPEAEAKLAEAKAAREAYQASVWDAARKEQYQAEQALNVANNEHRAATSGLDIAQGGNGFAVSIDDQARADLEQMLGGSSLTDDQIAGLVGARPGDGVTVSGKREYFEIKLSGTSADPTYVEEKYAAQRRLYRDPTSGKLVMYNANFYVDDALRGQGIGVEVFGKEVKNLADSGVAEIGTTAVGSGGGVLGPVAAGAGEANGYYTWARFGYNGKVPWQEMFDNGLDKSIVPPDIRAARTIQQLMATPGGADFWKQWGVDWDGTFNLRPNSVSMRVLKAYLQSKGLNFDDL